MKSILFALLLLTCAAPNAYSVTARSWIVANAITGNIVDSKNDERVQSIASITKLVTVMVVLDSHQNLDERIKKLTRREVIQVALVRSVNSMADELCDNYIGGRVACIRAMNQKVRSLGLVKTKFFEPTGLDPRNVSTAKELVKIVLESQKYPEIVQAAQTSTLNVEGLTFHNTNHDIWKHIFVVSKTGYIHQSGGCIATIIDTKYGKRVVVVLHSKNTHTRVPEVEYLANLEK